MKPKASVFSQKSLKMNELSCTIFEFLIAVTKSIIIFQGLTPCCLVEIYVTQQHTSAFFRAEDFPFGTGAGNTRMLLRNVE